MKKLLSGFASTVFLLAIVAPLVWTYISSVKTGIEIVGSPWSLPTSLQWVNFSHAWHDGGIGPSLMNSLIVSVSTLVILIPAGAMAAYVFAKFSFPGSNLLFGGFLGGMMFPNFLIIVPLFMLLRSISLVDTRLGLIIVYVAYSMSFTVFVLTGFFQSLPSDLGEAAMMDGCTDSSTFWKIMLPLAKPGLIVVAIFNGIGLWNEYGLALVLMPTPKNHTLPIAIANLAMAQEYQSDWGALFAGLVIVMTPVLIIYWIFRDRIYDTMLAGALKG
jgi:N-acetylglucosamine transport system permease protein